LQNISVYPGACYERLRRLFLAVSELESVQLNPIGDIDIATGDPIVCIGVPVSVVERAAAAGRRIFAFAQEATSLSAEPNAPIKFSASVALDRSMRGQKLEDATVPCAFRTPEQAEEVIASKGSNAVWSRITRGEGTADILNYIPPDLGSSGNLFEYLEPGNFIRLLPLLHFIREISGSNQAERPLRSSFMFDDPNLHWSSYGYIDYPTLLQSAERNNYHVAFATVPLDSRFVHKSTAKLFREHGNRVSLLIHGNNHTKEELAQPDSTHEQKLRLGAQALRRICRFERSTGIEVSRGMAAPHGACTQAMGAALLELGFDGACISRGSLMNHNPQTSWPPTVGLNVAEFFDCGLPVIPRFRLTNRCQTNIVLAAFLGQAIIPVGHHQDVRDGYKDLEILAAFINSLGSVEWSNLTDILKSSYRGWIRGDTLRIRAFSHHMQVKVPPAVRRVSIQAAWGPGSEQTNVVVDQSATNNTHDLGTKFVCSPISTNGVMKVHYSQPRANSHPAAATRSPIVWPITRRLLSEARDRLAPLLSRATSR